MLTIQQQILNVKVRMYRKNTNHFYYLVSMMHPTVDDFLEFLNNASEKDLTDYGNFTWFEC